MLKLPLQFEGVARRVGAKSFWRPQAPYAEPAAGTGNGAPHPAIFYGPLPHGFSPVAQAANAQPHPTTHALQRRWAERGPPRPERVFLARGPGLLSLIGPICPAPSSGAAPRPAIKTPLERAPQTDEVMGV